MDSKISVIIPVYNGEIFVEKCLYSVMNQTMNNLQILVVDDGSEDHTLKILRNIERNDSRIKVIHQENRGVANARNTALALADGDWIIFVDSDDTIRQDYCSNMLEVAELLNVDVLISYKGLENERKTSLIKEKKDLILGCLSFSEFISDFNIDAPWGKIFKRSILEEKLIRFPENLTRSEDALFCATVYENANRIGVFNQFGYIHNKREGSLCRSYSPRSTTMLENILFENKKWVLTYHPNEKEYYNALWYRVLPGIVECENTYFLHRNNVNKKRKKALQYQKFLNQKLIKEAIQQLKIRDIKNKQYCIRLCFYKLFLGWLFVLLKRGN